MLAKCDRAMKVVRENKRQFHQKVQRLWRKLIFVYIDEEFAINGIHRLKNMLTLSC